MHPHSALAKKASRISSEIDRAANLREAYFGISISLGGGHHLSHRLSLIFHLVVHSFVIPFFVFFLHLRSVRRKLLRTPTENVLHVAKSCSAFGNYKKNGVGCVGELYDWSRDLSLVNYSATKSWHSLVSIEFFSFGRCKSNYGLGREIVLT